MKKILTTIAVAVLGVSTFSVAQDSNAGVDDLLKKVQEGRVSESAAHKQRERQFLANQATQQKALTDERATQARLERESTRLEKTKADNEQKIAQLVELRRERLGQLQELFGVLQQGAGDLKAIIETSHISVDHTGRLERLQTLIDKAGETSELPTIDEIRIWPTEMVREMIESGKVVTFQHAVRRSDGTTETIDLTRVGDYGFVGEGNYYELKNGGVVAELPRQPASRFLDEIGPFQSATSGVANLGIDPSRGQILAMEVQRATLEERIEQGGPVGYITLGLGVIGVFFAIVQWVYLFFVGQKVRSQIRSSEPKTNNPLGRVLAVYHNNKTVDVETLELKLDEAILKETPALERFLTLVKLISAVAPLFGLLGTVTGMIETFQAITLFGTGDPAMMANGISMALVTTVEGLTVAIPTLMLHSFVSGSSKRIIHVLEEQSAGIIAVHAEEENQNAG